MDKDKFKKWIMKRLELTSRDLIFFVVITIGYLLFGHLFISLNYVCPCKEGYLNYTIPMPSIDKVFKSNKTYLKPNFTYEHDEYLFNSSIEILGNPYSR